MAELGQEICSAIDSIVKKRISELNFDRTIQGTIIECTNPAMGEYKIKYQDSKIIAFCPEPKAISYKPEDPVYILVPFNDLSARKTIIGMTSGNPKDGLISSWQGATDPGLNTFPTTEWYTDSLKDLHIGDSYRNTDTNALFTFSKNQEGAYYWAEAPEGASPPLFKITNTAPIFKKSTVEGLSYSPSSITLETFISSNITNATYRWTKGSAPEVTIGTDSSLLISPGATEVYICELRGQTSGAKAVVLRDQVTVPMLEDGSSAMTVILSNESMTFSAPAEGFAGISYDDGACDITAYIGTRKLSYSSSGAQPNNSFRCSIKTPISDGLTLNAAPFTTISGVLDAIRVKAPEAMGTDTESLTIITTIKNGIGIVSNIEKTINYSLSRAGRNSKRISVSPESQTIIKYKDGSYSVSGRVGVRVVGNNLTESVTIEPAYYNTLSEVSPVTTKVSLLGNPATKTVYYDVPTSGKLVITATAGAADGTMKDSETINIIEEGADGQSAEVIMTVYGQFPESPTPADPAATLATLPNAAPVSTAAGWYSQAPFTVQGSGNVLWVARAKFNSNTGNKVDNWVKNVYKITADYVKANVAIYGGGKNSFTDLAAGYYIGMQDMDENSETPPVAVMNIGDNSSSVKWDGTSLIISGPGGLSDDGSIILDTEHPAAFGDEVFFGRLTSSDTVQHSDSPPNTGSPMMQIEKVPNGINFFFI